MTPDNSHLVVFGTHHIVSVCMIFELDIVIISASFE